MRTERTFDLELERLFVPLQSEQQKLVAISAATEDNLDHGYDPEFQLEELLTVGRDATRLMRGNLISRLGEVASLAFDDLGRKDRKQVTNRLKDSPVGLLNFLGIAEGITGDSRKVLAMHYLAREGLLASKQLPTVATKFISQMTAQLGAAEYTNETILGFLSPEIIVKFLTIHSTLYRGVILGQQGVGFHLSDWTYRDPLEGHSEAITDNPYFMTAKKYRVLGNMVEDQKYSSTHSFGGSVSTLPVQQRQLFRDTARLIASEKRNFSDTYWNGFWNNRYSKKQWDGTYESKHEDEARQQNRQHDKRETSTFAKPNSQLESIYLQIENDSCVRTLRAMDQSLVLDVLKIITDIRNTDDYTSDRAVYLSFRRKLESIVKDDTYEDFNSIVQVMGLLLGGNVSRTAAFPVAK